MRTYSQGGKAAVIWMNEPYPRDERRAPMVTAVNAALPRAARGLDRVRVLDLAAIFTPGRRYKKSLVRDGRRVRLRRPDGIHLARGGARIAAGVVITELRRLGVLSAPTRGRGSGPRASPNRK